MKHLITAAFIALAGPGVAQASPIALCSGASELVEAIAAQRDKGTEYSVVLARLLQAGMDPKLATDMLNMVYREARHVDPEKLAEIFLNICIDGLV